MNPLETLDEIKSGATTLAELLREDGYRVGMAGRPVSPRYKAELAEAAHLVARVYKGNKWAALKFQEAMSTSDFPLLFGDILDRQMLGSYQAWPATWSLYAKRGTVRDFRTVSRFTMDGAEGVLPEVLEGENYNASQLTEGRYQFSVKKFGRRLPFTWETLVNDDLDAFRGIPERMGRSASRSEQRFATTLYIDANGPHASLYTAGNKNIVNVVNSGGPFTGINPPLSIVALQQAMVVLAKMLDADSEPIVVDSVTLVVPIALEITARNILNATELRINAEPAGGGTANTQVIAQNWMKGRVTVAVDPYMSSVAATANGGTSWALFANPNMGRPGLEVAFLAGHETPEIWVKSPNAMRVGGGMVSPFDGDFDADGVQYRIRHVFGGGRMDPKMTVASNGSGV